MTFDQVDHILLRALHLANSEEIISYWQLGEGFCRRHSRRTWISATTILLPINSYHHHGSSVQHTNLPDVGHMELMYPFHYDYIWSRQEHPRKPCMLCKLCIFPRLSFNIPRWFSFRHIYEMKRGPSNYWGRVWWWYWIWSFWVGI